MQAVLQRWTGGRKGQVQRLPPGPPRPASSALSAGDDERASTESEHSRFGIVHFSAAGSTSRLKFIQHMASLCIHPRSS
jgi:hypothetical protein